MKTNLMNFKGVAEIGDVVKVADDHESAECIGQFGQIVGIHRTDTILWAFKCFFPSLDDHYWVRENQIGWLWKAVQ